MFNPERELAHIKPEVFSGIPVSYGEVHRDPESDDPLSGNTSHSPRSLPTVYNWLTTKPPGIAVEDWVTAEQAKATSRLEALYTLLTQRTAINIALTLPVHGDSLADVDFQPEKYLHTLATSDRVHADATITHTPERGLVFNPADCPVVNLAYVNQSGVEAISQIHAGIRGLTSDVIGQTIHSLQSRGLNPKDALAYVSPHALNFAIDGELLENVRAAGLESYIDTNRSPRGFRIDMSRLALDQLTAVGIPQDNIEIAPTDTMSEPRYHSEHIQSGSATERQSDNPAIVPFARNGIFFVKNN